MRVVWRFGLNLFVAIFAEYFLREWEQICPALKSNFPCDFVHFSKDFRSFAVF